MPVLMTVILLLLFPYVMPRVAALKFFIAYLLYGVSHIHMTYFISQLFDDPKTLMKCNCFLSCAIQIFRPIITCMVVVAIVGFSQDSLFYGFSVLFFISSPVAFGIIILVLASKEVESLQFLNVQLLNKS
jgi:hypothetical protein